MVESLEAVLNVLAIKCSSVMTNECTHSVEPLPQVWMETSIPKQEIIVVMYTK